MGDSWHGELPVAVELPSRLEAEVTAYLEREVGWRRVPPQGPPTPALLLTQRSRPWPPCVLVFDELDVPGVMTPAADAQGVLDVIRWPGERARLAACAARLPALVTAPGPATLRVGGDGAGVGTSTCALTLAGLHAWAGRRVVVVGGGDLLPLAGVRDWRGPSADELGRLGPLDAAGEFGRVARPVRGIAGLWLLPATRLPHARGWPVDLLVADVGVARGPADADVLVRPGLLPYSARVARAGRLGRVPAGVPGSFLATVRARLGGTP